MYYANEITGQKVKNPKAYAFQMLEKGGSNAENARQKVLTLSVGQQQRVGGNCQIFMLSI